MAKLKQKDILELSDQELVEKESQVRGEYRELKFQHTVTPLENPLLLREMRRDISRLKTEIKKREIAVIEK